MAREGADIVICARSPDTLKQAEADIRSEGVRCLSVKCDVSSAESVTNLAQETLSTFGTLDNLVNNAALVQTGERNEAMRTKWYKMVTTPVRKTPNQASALFEEKQRRTSPYAQWWWRCNVKFKIT
jgi:NAD(P)-dependent dehydrogenase (short-subunit alcohol dehydrogenase family)